MKILTDRIYGRFEIDEAVLIDLLDSAAIQRLHGVLQHGISGLIGVTRATTRYEHSVGVLLLVRSWGARLEEQIAALLHDVSHTAFSHVVDYVFEGHDTQSYHDIHRERYVASTDLPAILEQHGYNWCDFACLDDEQQAERYPLLEQPAPALCADRLDYFLRDSLDLGLADQKDINEVLSHLCLYQGRVVVDNLETAGWLARTYMAADQASWANFREVGLYELTARAIRYALEIGVLSEADLWGTDEPAWEKLLNSQDDTIQKLISLINPATRFTWDEIDPTYRVSTKLRTIDPGVLFDDQVYPLSVVDPEYARQRLTYHARYSGKWPIKVEME